MSDIQDLIDSANAWAKDDLVPNDLKAVLQQLVETLSQALDDCDGG